MEGTRPVLVEVQALAAPSGYGTPQRVATGLDPKRLAVLLAVLERRGGTSFAALDVFVQATAGRAPGRARRPTWRWRRRCSPALHNRPVPADVLYLGEIGLGGEVRPIGGMERRLARPRRLGFRRVFASDRNPPRGAGHRRRRRGRTSTSW